MSKIKSFFINIRLYINLIIFDLQLKKFGFHILFKKYVTNYPVVNVNLESNNILKRNSEIKEYLRLIDVICILYPLNAQCIHRSFLAFRYLRTKFGIPVQLVIGVKKFPFSAHAWLVCNGKNVNEDITITSEFNIILQSEK